MVRRPWVVVAEVPGEGIGEGRHGRLGGATRMVGGPWAVRTAIKAMMAQLQASVLLVLPDSHGQATNRFRGHWTCGQPLGDGSCGGWPPANGGH